MSCAARGKELHFLSLKACMFSIFEVYGEKKLKNLDNFTQIVVHKILPRKLLDLLQGEPRLSSAIFTLWPLVLVSI